MIGKRFFARSSANVRSRGVARRRSLDWSCLAAGFFLFGAVALRAQWIGQDIGPVAAPGQSAADGGTFTVVGSGADIWGASDAFRFHAQPISGDGTITARVTGIGDTNGWAKAGLMIRDS